jgi:hypothetical protein
MLASLKRLGYRLLLASGRTAPDLPDADRAIIGRVRSPTRTGTARLAAMIAATRHIARHRIPGDVVECGVWRGGSMIAAALALLEERDTTRTLWLSATYAGKVTAEPRDQSDTGIDAPRHLAKLRAAGKGWDAASLPDVQANLASTSYRQVRYVVGPVESTIPAEIPDRIALLRLDTDFYASTAHELSHLYPRLVPGGILIIDDYGHWAGCREAVDEYFAGQPVFLHRIDYTGRLLVKPRT